MGTTGAKLTPTVDLSGWIVNQPHHRQLEAGPSHSLLSFEEVDIEEDNEPRPAGPGPKRRKRDAKKCEKEEWEEEREFDKKEGETRKKVRNKPLRTGRFHNPKCERCERSGKSCEKQKAGVACYQCAVRRARCEPTGGKPKNPPMPIRTVVEKLALASASRVAPQPSSPPAINIPQISPQSTQTRFVCDKHYYHESGDLPFVVEGTLFKVKTFAVSQTVLCKLTMDHCGLDTPIPARKM